MEGSLNQKYGLKQVINASGRMSILGVSAPSDRVMDAMKTGGQSYVEIDDLLQKAGDHIANKLGSEAAVVVNSASSGIALTIAGMITRGNRHKSEKLHQLVNIKNEIVLFKGHNVQYGAPIETMVYLGGGKLVEAGYANEGSAEQLADAITENTAAILYVKSHHAVQKNMISVEEAWKTARNNHVPLIVDAAAEEDLKKYISISDVVIFSGSKALEGPTSGIAAGKKVYVDWIKMQLHYIGRSMKVGKETTFGLLQALDDYANKPDNSKKEKECLEILKKLDFDGVKVTIVQDEAGRSIYRARIQIDPAKANQTASSVNEQLKTGDIAIYTRDYGLRQGYFDIDPRPLKPNDAEIIYLRMKEILGGGQG